MNKQVFIVENPAVSWNLNISIPEYGQSLETKLQFNTAYDFWLQSISISAFAANKAVVQEDPQRDPINIRIFNVQMKKDWFNTPMEIFNLLDMTRERRWSMFITRQTELLITGFHGDHTQASDFLTGPILLQISFIGHEGTIKQQR